MTIDPPDDHLAFDEFWIFELDPERQRADYANRLTDEKVKWIAETYSEETFKERKREIWKTCEATGMKVCDLEPYIALHQGHLGRKLKAGTASEKELWTAVKVSGLDPHSVMAPPNALHEFRGKTRTVEVFRHRCETVDLPISTADRIPAEKLHDAHGAFLQVLLSDGVTVTNWLQLAVPIACDFSRAAALPEIVAFVEDIYREATRFIGGDQEALSLLEAWSPQRAGLPTALGRVAQAWNRYQMHWFFATEVIESL